MDSEWFKNRHREIGVTQAEAAALLGKSPTFMTRVYAGTQELRIAEARILAKVLRVPPGELLRRAGMAAPLEGETDPIHQAGLGEGQAAYEVRPVEIEFPTKAIEDSNQTTWCVETTEMVLAGYKPGDYFLLDGSATPKGGDAVIAQIYDWKSGTAQTVFRQFEPPYLLTAAATHRRSKPEIVDNERVVIKGVVLRSWRERADVEEHDQL